MSIRRTLLAILLLSALTGLAATTVSASTYLPLESDVAAWAGTGEEIAFLSFDFNDASTATVQEVVLGVNFPTTSGTITVAQALETLDQYGPLDFTSRTLGPDLILDTVSLDLDGLNLEGRSTATLAWNFYNSSDSGSSYTLAGEGDWQTATLAPADACAFSLSPRATPTAPDGPRWTPPSTIGLDADVMAWAGEGPRQALMVFDFDFATDTGAEIVLGVNFSSPTITAAQALDILQDQTSLQITSSTFPGIGLSVDAIRYTHDGQDYYAESYTAPDFSDGSYWSQWTDREAGASYGSNILGISEQPLHHLDTMGFQHVGWFDATSGPNGPRLTPTRDESIEDYVLAWAGSGERKAYFCFDFDVSDTESAEIVLGLRFDQPSLSAAEALDILQSAGDLEITSSTFAGLGLSVDRIRYELGSAILDRAAYTEPDFSNGTYWSQWQSRTNGLDYEASLLGISSRRVHHMDSDGYQYVGWFDASGGPNGPRVLSATRARAWSLYR